MSSNIIEISGLNKTFRVGGKHEPVRALDDVSVTVREGSCLAVVGESGSGKTTLARVLVGLETKDSGEVRIAGSPVTASPSAACSAPHSFIKWGGPAAP